MKNLLSVLVLLCLLKSSSAANYYFSYSIGDNSRSSAQAQNPNTPWRTISHLNSIFSSLEAGDSVFLRRGDVFPEVAISITTGGFSGSPIFIGAYGSGAKPVISMLRTVTFGSPTGSVYPSTTDLSDITGNLNVVLINGVITAMGRYPNMDNGNGGYLNITSRTGSTSITSSSSGNTYYLPAPGSGSPAFPNFYNSEIVIRKSRFVINRGWISSHSTNSVSYTISDCDRLASSDQCNDPIVDYGFFIQNHLSTLDQAGEWFFNKSNDVLYVYSTSGEPTNVKVSVGDYCIRANSNDSWVTIDNLTLEGADSIAIDITSGSNNINVQNCDIKNVGADGIRTLGNSTSVLNNSITNCLSNGVHTGALFGNPTTTTAQNPTITGNYIYNIGPYAAMTQNGQWEGIGIACFSLNAYIGYNIVRKCCYNGINTYYRNGWTVIGNLIDSTGIGKDDGGGIYTVNNSQQPAYDLEGRLIANNLVMNSIGAPYGTKDFEYKHQGIYLDNNTDSVKVFGNTVINVERSYFLNHGTTRNVLRNNTSINGRLSGFYTVVRSDDPARDNRITKMLYYNNTTTVGLLRYIEENAGELNQFGVMDSNYYIRPRNPSNRLFYTNYGTSDSITFQQWKNSTPYDDNSSLAVEPYIYNNSTDLDSSVVILINQTFLPQTTSSLGNWNWVNGRGTVYNRISTLLPTSGEVLFKTTFNPPDQPAPPANPNNPRFYPGINIKKN